MGRLNKYQQTCNVTDRQHILIAFPKISTTESVHKSVDNPANS